MSEPGLLCDECSSRRATVGTHCNPCAAEVEARQLGYQTARAQAEAQGRADAEAARQAIEHPPHYTNHPSGIECIEVTRHMGFNLGNAVKYIWRCDLKKDAIEDLKKAIWYLEDEIMRREREAM